jgi:hypothetical protein
MKVSHASDVISKQTCPDLFAVSSAPVYHALQLGKHCGLHCIQFKMDDQFSNMSKHIKQ